MGLRGMELALVLVLVGALWAGARAQSGCTAAIIGLSPCLNYMSGNSSTPAMSCCTQLASVVRSQPQCLCTVLSGSGSSFGVSINQTRALALPGACNVQTPPVSRCNSATATAPASSQATSPVESPSTSTPLVPRIPSGSSSNTVPSIGGQSSGANVIKLTLPFLLFLLFLASSASVLNSF